MAKKHDLIEEAKGLGIELDSNETVADLEAKISFAKSDAAVQAIEKEAKELGVELLYNETPEELEKKFSDARKALSSGGTKADGELTRSKVNRGSRRRIERAITRLNEEIDAAIKEFDLQAFIADEDGNRTAEWPAVTRLRAAKADVNDQVNQLLAG